MFKRLFFAGSLMASAAVLPATAAFAQYDDMGLRVQAIDQCMADPGNLGYANQEVCIEAIYQSLLQQNQWGNGDYSGGGTASDPYNQTCNSAATRITVNCPR